MQDILVSIIIPVRNGVNYLSEAISSIRAQNTPVEVIVVDDGSTDETAALAKSLSCVVVSLPPSGPSAARNAGLQLAKGKFVMFLDHDDLLCNNSLATLLAAFDFATQAVSAKLQDFISPELTEQQKALLVSRQEPYGGLLTGAYLFRREVLDQTDGFDESLQGGGEGVDFLLRCAEIRLNVKKLDFVSCYRRLHATNTGRLKRTQEYKGFATSLRMKLRRG